MGPLQERIDEAGGGDVGGTEHDDDDNHATR
jgi:hypothetical protein